VRWLKEPLVHFMAGGGLLFAAYAWLNPVLPDVRPAARQVRVGAGEVRWLTETWVRRWQREPTVDELRVLVTNLLKEELLSREARELGLDEGDTIVRRRLAQKLEFLVQDTARLTEPTEEELRRFYDAAPELYRTEPRISFIQVYFSRERRRDPAQDARHALATLRRAPTADTGDLGDRLLVEGELRDADRQTVASAFGPDFASAVFELQPGAWRGPIESGYGLHLVRVSSMNPGRPRPLTEMRAQVVERWREQKQREAEAMLFTRLMDKYEVVLDESVKSVVGPLPLRLVAHPTR